MQIYNKNNISKDYNRCQSLQHFEQASCLRLLGNFPIIFCKKAGEDRHPPPRKSMVDFAHLKTVPLSCPDFPS